MNRSEQVLILVAAIFIAAAGILPIWRIEIWAPQYPEGLLMQIGASDITGNVDQINILNHYIGMKKITPADFSELRILPWIFGALVVSGLYVSWLKSRRAAKIWFMSKLTLGAVGFVDFALWGYDFGHNLDPNAPIKVPGLSYQPPLIGGKTLLNINSYSLPDIGGYLLISAFILSFLAIFGDELTRRFRASGSIFPVAKKGGERIKKQLVLLLLIFPLLFVACKVEPQAIVAGADHCDSCRMKISDTRFSGEIITAKGRVLKFDSIGCLGRALKKEPENVKKVFVSDYFDPTTLIEASKARFLIESQIHGPMGPGPIASRDEAALLSLKQSKSKDTGRVVDWNAVNSSFN